MNKNSYASCPFRGPEEFEGKYPNSKVLIVSNGPSTKDIVSFKSQLKQYFDIIIAVNHGFKYFDDVADFHIVTEKPSPTNHVAEMLEEQSYNLKTPRIINWKGVTKYNSKYNLYKTVRCQMKDGFNIRKYKQKGYEGLLTGPVNKRNMAVGSVTLNSMHFASMLGASQIYLIGADLVFKDKFDHFYEDNQYRDAKEQNKLKPENRIHIVSVEHKGTVFSTTDYFKDSADCINNMIKTTFKDVKVYDFSDGLITAATQLKVSEFFTK